MSVGPQISGGIARYSGSESFPAGPAGYAAESPVSFLVAAQACVGYGARGPIDSDFGTIPQHGNQAEGRDVTTYGACRG